MRIASSPASAAQPNLPEKFFKSKRRQINAVGFLLGAAAGLCYSLADSSQRTAAIAFSAFSGCALIANGCRQTNSKDWFYSQSRLALGPLKAAALGFATVSMGHCLSELFGPQRHREEFLRKAAQAGNLEEVKKILPEVNRAHIISLAFLDAVRECHLNVVELILKEKNVDSDDISRALWNAVLCKKENVEWAKLIMGSKAAQYADRQELGRIIGSALSQKRPNIARIILTARPDASIVNDEGVDSQDVLCKIKDKDADLVALLLQHNQFYPPLLRRALAHYVQNCEVENVKSLLENVNNLLEGADPSWWSEILSAEAPCEKVREILDSSPYANKNDLKKEIR